MPKQAILNNRTVLEAALEGLELKRARLDEQIAEIRSLLGQRKRGRPRRNAAAPVSPTEPKAKRRRFSAATRRRMSEAQKRRYAQAREPKEEEQPSTPAKKAGRKTSRKKPARKTPRKTAAAATAPTTE